MQKHSGLLSLLAVALVAILPRISYGGEINIAYTNLGGKLTLTALQGGMPVGDPTCSARSCTVELGADGGLAAVDFPVEFLVAGVESVGSAQTGAPLFTDLVHYSATHWLKGPPNNPLRGPCEDKPADCWALVELEFFAYPYDFNPTAGNSPSFQQPLADGLEHDLTSYFENQALNTGIVVGLPPAAIHVSATSDGTNAAVPEPSTTALIASGLLLLVRRRNVRLDVKA